MNRCYQWFVVAGLWAWAPLALGDPAAEGMEAAGQDGFAARLQEPALERVAAEEQALAGVEAEVGRCRTARQLVLGTKLLLSVGGTQSAMAEPWVSEWEERAARGEVRIKKQWVPPQVAANAAGEASALIVEAGSRMALGDHKGVTAKLRRASNADPLSGRAEFLRGLIAVFGKRDPDLASRSFLEALAREPTNGCALNNLAICECELRQFGDARAHFESAGRFIDADAVIQNVAFALARLQSDGKKSSDRHRLKFEKLLGVNRIDPPAAWRFLDPLGVVLTTEKPSWLLDLCQPKAAPAAAPRAGVVIAKETLLTPAIGPSAGITITVRTRDEPPIVLPATVIATSQSLGISLVRCATLQIEPALLAKTDVAVGGEIRTLAGRWMAPDGDTPPDMTCKVVATDIMPGIFSYAAASSPGIAGLPLVDASGCVVGLVTNTPRVTRSGTTYALGLSVDRLWPFLGDHLPSLKPAQGDECLASEKLARRTVLVIEARAPAP